MDTKLKDFNESIIQNVTEGIAVTDEEGAFIFVNPALAAMLGYTLEELLGQHWTTFIPAEQHTIIQAADERRRCGESDRYGVDLMHKDGTRLPVLVSGSPRRDADTGEFVGTLMAFADISERVQVEENLARRAREMAALYETSLEINAQLDLSTLLQVIVRRAAKLLRSHMGGLYLVSPNDEQVLELVVVHNLPADYTGLTLRRGEGLAGRVAQTGQPMMVADYSSWEGRMSPFGEGLFRRILSVPLKVGEQIIGVLYVCDNELTGVFDQDEIRLARLFADQAAVAIQNSRLFQKTQQRLQVLSLLFDTSATISTSLDIDNVLRATAQQITAALGIEGCTFSLWDQEQNVLVSRLDYATDLEWWQPEAPGTTYHLDEYATTLQVLTSRQPLVIQAGDPDADPAELAWMKTEEIITLLMIPMVVRDKVIGLLELQEACKEREFTSTEIGLCQMLANQAAAAVENARLFQAEREQRELAEALRQATSAVSSTLDWELVLDQILEQMNRVIPNDTTNVMLIECDHARIVGWRGYERFGSTDHLASVSFCVSDTTTLHQMYETGEPIIISDTETYAGWILVSDWVRSYTGAPICARGEVIGFLNANSATPNFFQQEHAERLLAFADQAGLAIENARMFQETSSRAEHLDTLNRTGLAITSALELDQMLNILHQQLDRLWDVDAFYVALYDQESGLIEFPLLTGSSGPAEIEPLDIHQQRSITGHVIQSKQALYLPDTQNVPREAAYVPIPVGDDPARSYMGVPLIFGEQVLGVLSVQGQEPNAFSPADLGLLTTIASQATIAIKNAQLFEQARQHNRELILLNRIIAASAASREIETILETVCQELARAFDIPNSLALLLDEGEVEVRVVAEYLAGDMPSVMGLAVPVENLAIAQPLLQHRQPLVIEDAANNPLLAFARELIRLSGTVSVLVVPLIVEERVVGGLGLAADEPRSFSADEVRLAERVAEQVSSALTRARLEEAQRRLSAAVEQAAEAIVVTDPQGTILYVNPAMERITGYDRASSMSFGLLALSPDGQDTAFYQDLWKMVTAGETWQGRFTDTRSDGSRYTVDLTVTPVRNPAGKIVNYVATLRDVTREVQLEEQFQQAQKMEALGRLASGVAHDFNNLLTVIHLSTRLLQRQLRPEDPLWEYVQRIQEAGERATNLTRQLLSFSRQDVIESQALNLNQVVGDSSRMLQRIIGEDIELITSLADDLWPVKVDPSQMGQAIVNLVVNARDAMPGGGRLSIETANAILDEASAARHVDVRPGQYVLLMVGDSGEGMDEEVKAHLFEPFFTTKRQGQGTGLGLSIVYGIVKQHGGHIEVASQVGQGTIFGIYLPRAREVKDLAPSSPSPAAPSGPLHGTETVLVVEDEEAVRDLAVRVLKACGYQVLVAEGGLMALELSALHEGPIHLLLTDVVMPQMGGPELASRLQDRRPETSVVFMSGYTDEAIVQHGLPAPGKILSKPFTIEALTHKIRAVLDGRE